jgi:hypothetical protein
MAVGIYGGECIEGHTVYIYDRGGVTRVAQLLDVSSVKWERDRDGISEANIVIEGSACSAQADVLANIEPKRSEVVIFRGADRVWEGPVWRVAWHSDYVQINAHDIMAYITYTPLSIAYDNRYQDNIDPDTGDNLGPLTRPTEVTTRINNILQHEMQRWEALDPPVNILPYLQIHHFPNEARTTAYTQPFEMTAGEHIQHLVHYSGADYTVVGRAFHAWDVSRYLGRTRTLTEEDFYSEVIITAYGADMTSSVYVVASDGNYGHAESPSPYYGPWTMILTAYNEEGTEEPTQAELNSQAQRNLSGRIPVPVEVRIPDNSSIRLNETLTINDLIPGVQMPLLATLNARRMSQMQKLDHLVVTETANGETVQVIMTPATKPDDDTPPEEQFVID